MEKKIYFALCTADGQTAAYLDALLRRWAEEICLELEIVRLPGVPAAADGYAVILADDSGDSGAHAALQQLRADGFAGGLVLLTGSDRFAIDGYQCHPDAVVRKPVSAGGLRRAMERCFACWSRGLKWIDLPLQHRRLRIPLYRLLYAEAAVRELAGGKLTMCDGRSISVARSLLRQVQAEFSAYRQRHEEGEDTL